MGDSNDNKREGQGSSRQQGQAPGHIDKEHQKKDDTSVSEIIGSDADKDRAGAPSLGESEDKQINDGKGRGNPSKKQR